MRHVPLRKPGQGNDRHGPARGRRWQSTLMVSVAAAGLAAAAVPAGTAAAAPAAAAPNSFKQTNLVANSSSRHPKLVDKNLKNAWGITAGPSTPIWVADNNSGKATVYSGGIKGSKVQLQLTVTVPGGNATGQVFNPSKAFPVGGASGMPALFIVDSDSVGSTQSPGLIAAWNGGAKFTVETSPTGGPGGETPAPAAFQGPGPPAPTQGGPQPVAAAVAP